MAATPESLILQHRQPLESSRNSSDGSANGSDADEMLMALAIPSSLHRPHGVNDSLTNIQYPILNNKLSSSADRLI